MLSIKVCRKCSTVTVGGGRPNNDPKDINKWLFPCSAFECGRGKVADVSKDPPPDGCPYALEHILVEAEERKDA